MRGSTAKALRRLAREATQGQPAMAYLSRQHSRNHEVPKRDSVTGAALLDKNGKAVMQTIKVTTTEQRIDPTCTRGYYKTLKREQKAGRFNVHTHLAEQARIEQERG